MSHDWREIARTSRMVLQDCESAMCGVWVELREQNIVLPFGVLEALVEMRKCLDSVKDYLAETPNPKYACEDVLDQIADLQTQNTEGDDGYNATWLGERVDGDPR